MAIMLVFITQVPPFKNRGLFLENEIVLLFMKRFHKKNFDIYLDNDIIIPYKKIR